MTKDKQLHLAAGAAIALLVGLFFSVPFALGAALVAGVGKEVYDYVANKQAARKGLPPPHSVEGLDALLTAMGGGLGAFAAVALKSFF